MCVEDVGIADFSQSEEPVCQSIQKLFISVLVILLYVTDLITANWNKVLIAIEFGVTWLLKSF